MIVEDDMHRLLEIFGDFLAARWLRHVVQGWLNYHAVPSNRNRIRRFVARSLVYGSK